jgi:Tol biopolymer transport system component
MMRTSSLRRIALVALAPLVASGCAWIARVSVTPNGGDANGESQNAVLSSDGHYVAFESRATNLVPGGGNFEEIYLRDLRTASTQRVAVTPDGGLANSSSSSPSISADGRYVAFHSRATNLVPGAYSGKSNVFVRDMATGTTVLASVNTTGGVPNGDSSKPAISANGGLYVAFLSGASDLVPGGTSGFGDVYVRDLVANRTIPVSVEDASGQLASGGGPPSISADGRYVAFYSEENLVGDADGFADVFVRDLVANSTVRVTVSSTGGPADGNTWSVGQISADGRVVAFASEAKNLVADDHSESWVSEVFVRDLDAGTTVRVSAPPGGDPNGSSGGPAVSADGTRVAFISGASNLVADDGNDAGDVFVSDLTTGTLTLVSRTTRGDQLQADYPWQRWPSLTGDGRYVAFASSGAFVPRDHNKIPDVYVRATVVPEIEGVAPSSIARGTTETFTLTGHNFTADATVGAFTISAGTNHVTVDSFTIVSDTEVQATISVDAGAPTEALAIVVTVPGLGPGQVSGSTGSCSGTCPQIT